MHIKPTFNSEADKESFYQVAKVEASEQFIICGDWNGHIGVEFSDFGEAQGGNTEGKRVLAFEVPSQECVTKI